MASTSIDWDEVQVTKSPKHKQVEVGFVKQGRGATVGSKDLCVRILAPDDYFPYKDESGHYYIAYIYEPAEVEITGTVTHTTGGICEPNSIIVPTEMDATSTFTIPKGETEVRVDLKLNQVLVDVSQTPDYKAAYTATITSVTNGKACGEPQCIKFNAGTSVIPPEPDPGPEPSPDTPVPPEDSSTSPCGPTDCTLTAIWQDVNGYAFHADFLAVEEFGNTGVWPQIGTIDTGSGVQNRFRIQDINGNDLGWERYKSSATDQQFGAPSNNLLQYLTTEFCYVPARLPPIPDQAARGFSADLPHCNVAGEDPKITPLGGQLAGDELRMKGVFLIEFNSDGHIGDVNRFVTFGAAGSTKVRIYNSSGVPTASNGSIGEAHALTFRGNGDIRFGLNKIGEWGTPVSGTLFYPIVLEVTYNNVATSVTDDENTPFTGLLQASYQWSSTIRWGPVYDNQAGGIQPGVHKHSGTRTQGVSWAGANSQWAPFDTAPFADRTTVTSFSNNDLILHMLALGDSDEFIRLMARKSNNYTPPDYCSRIPNE